VALAKRAALEISVSPLDSIRRSRQTAFLSCSLAGQGAENEIWSVQDWRLLGWPAHRGGDAQHEYRRRSCGRLGPAENHDM